MHYILELKKIILQVKLGVDALERKALQPIEINITIRFENMPVGCDSDKISDTICYDNLVAKLTEFCANNEYNLLEHLSFVIYKYLKDTFLKVGDYLELQVCKDPPIQNVKGGCCFIIKG